MEEIVHRIEEYPVEETISHIMSKYNEIQKKIAEKEDSFEIEIKKKIAEKEDSFYNDTEDYSKFMDKTYNNYNNILNKYTMSNKQDSNFYKKQLDIEKFKIIKNKDENDDFVNALNTFFSNLLSKEIDIKKDSIKPLINTKIKNDIQKFNELYNSLPAAKSKFDKIYETKAMVNNEILKLRNLQYKLDIILQLYLETPISGGKRKTRRNKKKTSRKMRKTNRRS